MNVKEDSDGKYLKLFTNHHKVCIFNLVFCFWVVVQKTPENIKVKNRRLNFASNCSDN
jgi:hypothetical protein